MLNINEFKLEQRCCKNKGCNKTFKVWIHSRQKICSIICWELINNKTWNKRNSLPVDAKNSNQIVLSDAAINKRNKNIKKLNNQRDNL